MHTGSETSKWVNNSKTQKILILEKILLNKKCLSMQKLKVHFYVQLTYDPSFTWFWCIFRRSFFIITVKLQLRVSTRKEQFNIFKFQATLLICTINVWHLLHMVLVLRCVANTHTLYTHDASCVCEFVGVISLSLSLCVKTVKIYYINCSYKLRLDLLYLLDKSYVRINTKIIDV